MDALKRRLVIVGSLAVIALAVGVMGPADAHWSEACPTVTHVAFNPVTGDPIRVGADPHINRTPTTLTYGWVCIDDGGMTGAHSVGTAGYHWANTTGASYAQHVVACPDVPSPMCDEAWTGAAVSGIAAGPGGGGATLCATFVVRGECEDIRVTVGPTAPPTTWTGNTGKGICGVGVNGTCTLKEATVTVGGTTVGTTLSGTVPHSDSTNVPVVTACINQGGAGNPANVYLGSSTCP